MNFIQKLIRSVKKRVRKIRELTTPRAQQGVVALRRRQLRNADAIVTTNEVTDHHGTGVVLSRIFGECEDILSIRSTHLYHEHNLGTARLCFNHEDLSRSESFARVLYALNGSTVKRVACVPYQSDELITAL